MRKLLLFIIMLLPILLLAQAKGGAGSNNGYYIGTLSAGTISSDSIVDTLKISKPIQSTVSNYGTAAQPAYALDGGGYGMYRASTTILFSTQGSRRLAFATNGILMGSSAIAGNAYISNATGYSSTVAKYGAYSAFTYGMGFEAANTVNLITSSVTRLKVADAGVTITGTCSISTVLKLPGLTTTQRNALTPVAGDIIYNTTDNKHQGYNGSTWNNFY